MDRHAFELTVDEAIERLPEWVLERIDNLVVVVEEWPNPEQDPEGEGILGIYEGVSLPERSGDYIGALPDRIVIFRGPHLELGLEPGELRDEVRRTLLHEVGHYLGIDDRRLLDLGWD